MDRSTAAKEPILRMPPRWRLFPKYASLIMALVGGMLLASGILAVYFSWQESRGNLIALQAEKARSAAARIEQYVVEIEHQLSWLELQTRDPTASLTKQHRTEYAKLLHQAPAVTEVAWVDAKGRERLRVSRLAIEVTDSGIDLSRDAAFLQSLNGGVYHGPVHFRQGSEPYMTMARRSGSGGGVTVVEVNLKFIAEVVSGIRIGQSGRAYVVDSKGMLIAHPDLSRVLAMENLNRLPQVAALAGAPGTDVTARDIDGNSVLSSDVSISALGWRVFVETPETEAFAPLYASVGRWMLLLGIGLVISIAASFFLARALVRPLRELQTGAARIGAGELDRQIHVRTGDELETLAEQFNQMASDLRSSYVGLERKVAERTRDLTTALEQQTATAEVLQVISSSSLDPQPVFAAILDNCERLFTSTGLAIFLLADDGSSRLAAFRGALHNASEGFRSHGHSVMPTAGSPHASTRSRALAPMVRDQQRIGMICAERHAADPFTQRELAILNIFADQAVIAVLNARQFRQIQESREAAEAANRSKSSFLAAASHDLRQPVHALGLYMATLVDQPLSPDQHDLVQHMEQSLAALEAMFNGLMDVSRIDAGAVIADPRPFAVGPMLHRLADAIAPQAAEKGLRLSVRIGRSPANARAMSDPLLVERILLNLLGNAVKYTSSGGVLASCRWRGGVDPFWRVEIFDTGQGIAVVDQARVFEEFYQVGNPERDRAKGLGLGLSIVQRLARILGHPLMLTSTFGRGTRFALDLPCTSATDAQVFEDQQARLVRGVVVAVIDDDPAVRQGTQVLLEQWGCRVFAGADEDQVLQALGIASDGVLQGIIADYRLREGRTGIQAIHALRAACGSSLPALIVSGECSAEHLDLVSAGGFDLLRKPVAPLRLSSWLARIAPSRGTSHARPGV